MFNWDGRIFNIPDCWLFNSKLRINIAIYVSEIFKNTDATDEQIISKIKGLAEKSLFLGRLSYLLNDDSQAGIIRDYVKKIISIVRIHHSNPDITAYAIGKEVNLKRDIVQNIIDAIKT